MSLLGKKISDLTTQIIGMVIDGVFLTLWAAITFGVDWVIAELEITGIAATLLLVYQILFGLATLVPVAVYIYTDVRVILRKATRRLEDDAQFHSGSRK